MINIYVGNLPYSTQEQDLIEHFAQWGRVDRATLVFDRETGRPRGFGFVEMEDPAQAQEAIEAAHGRVMNGRPLTVNQARPRGSGRTETPTLTRTAVAHGPAHRAADGHEAAAPHGYANRSPVRREPTHDAGRTAPAAETNRYAGPPRHQSGGYANYLYDKAG